MIQIGDKKAYDVDEMADFLQIHAVTVRKLCKSGKIEAKKIGRKWHATKDALQRFLGTSEEERK